MEEKNLQFNFLLDEYSEMFNEKRYYDGRVSTLLSLYITVISFSVTLVTLLTGFFSGFHSYIFIVASIMDAIVGIVIFISLYFNRVNYIKVCRQINAIRNFCLEKNIPEFKSNNLMYTDSEYPKFHMKNSMHYMFFYIIVAINGFFFGVATFFTFIKIDLIVSIIISFVIGFAIIAFQLVLLFRLMKKRDLKYSKNKF